MQKTICYARMSAGMGVDTEVGQSTGKKGLNPVWKGSGKTCQKQWCQSRVWKEGRNYAKRVPFCVWFLGGGISNADMEGKREVDME